VITHDVGGLVLMQVEVPHRHLRPVFCFLYNCSCSQLLIMLLTTSDTAVFEMQLPAYSLF
jgi:hypothetical protein